MMAIVILLAGALLMIIKHDGTTLVTTGQPAIDRDDEFSVNLVSLGRGSSPIAPKRLGKCGSTTLRSKRSSTNCCTIG
jgi:hypothetical protein